LKSDAKGKEKLIWGSAFEVTNISARKVEKQSIFSRTSDAEAG